VDALFSYILVTAIFFTVLCRCWLYLRPPLPAEKTPAILALKFMATPRWKSVDPDPAHSGAGMFAWGA